MADQPDVSRRRLLQGAALLSAAPLAAGGASAQTVASASGAVCRVQRQQVLGPYYVDERLVRADIREDREGVPLRLELQVVDAACMAVAGARVDVWHCDARGYYSGFPRQGDARAEDLSEKTFLRGTQTTGADGRVGFDTIWPGWYEGRTTHIHFRVFLSERDLLVAQLYFPDAINAFLYEHVAPYTERARPRDTVNADDFIARSAGHDAFAAIREEADRYVATLVVGVDPAVDAAAPDGPGGPPEGTPPPDGAPPPPPAG